MAARTRNGPKDAGPCDAANTNAAHHQLPQHLYHIIRRLLLEIGAGRDQLPSPFTLSLWRMLRDSAMRDHASGIMPLASDVDGCVKLALACLGCPQEEGQSQLSQVCSASAVVFAVAVLHEWGTLSDLSYQRREHQHLSIRALCVDLIAVLPHCPDPSRYDALFNLLAEAALDVQTSEDDLNGKVGADSWGEPRAGSEHRSPNPYWDAIWRVLTDTASPRPRPQPPSPAGLEHWFLRGVDFSAWSAGWVRRLTPRHMDVSNGDGVYSAQSLQEFVQRSQRYLAALVLNFGEVTLSARNQAWAEYALSQTHKDLQQSLRLCDQTLDAPSATHVALDVDCGGNGDTGATSGGSGSQLQERRGDAKISFGEVLATLADGNSNDALARNVTELDMLLMDWVDVRHWDLEFEFEDGEKKKKNKTAELGGVLNRFGLSQGPRGLRRGEMLAAIAASIARVRRGSLLCGGTGTTDIDDGGIVGAVLGSHLRFFQAAYPFKIQALLHALLASDATRALVEPSLPHHAAALAGTVDADAGASVTMATVGFAPLGSSPAFAAVVFSPCTAARAQRLCRRALRWFGAPSSDDDNKNNDDDDDDNNNPAPPPLARTLLRSHRAGLAGPAGPAGAGERTDLTPMHDILVSRIDFPNQDVPRDSRNFCLRNDDNDKGSNADDNANHRTKPADSASPAASHPALRTLSTPCLQLLLMDLLDALAGPRGAASPGATGVQQWQQAKRRRTDGTDEFAAPMMGPHAMQPSAGAAGTTTTLRYPFVHEVSHANALPREDVLSQLAAAAAGGESVSGCPPMFLDVLAAAALDVGHELRSRLGGKDASLQKIVHAIEELVVCGRGVCAATLLAGMLDAKGLAPQAVAGSEESRPETALKVTAAMLRRILRSTTHTGVRDLSAAVLQHLDPPAEPVGRTAFLCDFDLCLDHISFPADEVASKATRSAKLAVQGISPEEDALYARKIFVALEHLHAQGIPIVVVTRNSEANVWFVLHEVVGAPTPWIHKVLSAYDVEAARRKQQQPQQGRAGGDGKKVLKWELVDSYFSSQQWVSTRYSEMPAGEAGAPMTQSSSSSTPRITRAVFVDDSVSEIQCMRDSPLNYVSCVQAWRPGKTPAGKRVTYADAKVLFGRVPGLFNNQHVLAAVWEALLLPGSTVPTALLN